MKLPKKIAALLTVTLVSGSGLGNLATVYAAKDLSSESLVGTGRWETAIEISKKGWSKSDEAVIVNDSALSDALTATPFAEAKDAPILLTQNNKLDDRTKAELKRLGVKKVYLIGGEAALNKSIENTLRSEKISIDRIQGATRYETSLELAKRLDKIKDVSEIAVVNGYKGIADAISIAPVAADKDMPIILSDPTKETQVSDEFIKSEDIKNSYIIGGTAVVSNQVVSKLPNAKRLEGQDRNETNAKVIETFYTKSEINNAYIAKDGIAKESELIDGLAIGVLAAKNDSPVILVWDKLNQKQKDVINTKSFKTITQVGGGSNQNGFNELKSIQEVTTYNVSTIAELKQAISNSDSNDVINMNIDATNEEILIKTDKKISINLSGSYRNTITVSSPNVSVVNKGTISNLVVKDSVGASIENTSGSRISNVEVQGTASNVNIVNKGTVTNIKNDAKGTEINNSGSITNRPTGNQTPGIEGNRPGGSTGGGGSSSGSGGSTENNLLSSAKKSAIEKLNAYKNQSDYNTANWDKIKKLKEDWTKIINNSVKVEDVNKNLKLAKEEIDKILTNDKIDQQEASKVIELIKLIREVTLEKNELIKNAEKAYNRLTPKQQKLVTNIDTLISARETYDKLEAEQKLDNVKKSAIKELESYKASNGNTPSWDKIESKIEEAIEDINKAETEEEVGEILELAIKDIEQILKNDQIDLQEALNVIKLIDSIGEVTLQSNESIENAETVYKSLTPKQQKLVTNIDTLKSARETYDNMKKEDDLKSAKNLAVAELKNYKNEADYNTDNWDEIETKIKEVIEKINEAGAKEEVAQILESAKEYINDIPTKDKINQQEASKVIELIDSIGEVKFEKKELIDSTRKGYESLRNEQKKLVNNINKLNDAEKAYPEAETYHYFNKAKDKIDKLPTLSNNIKLDHKDDIYEAREYFNRINKELLADGIFGGDKSKYEILGGKLSRSEKKLQELLIDKADKDAADKVIKMINGIGIVLETEESRLKIELARNAYDALNKNAKSKITADEYQVLLNAEETFKNFNPIYKIRNEAVKDLNSYVNLDHYDNSSRDEITNCINKAIGKINESESEDVIIAIVKEAKDYIDSFENNAESMRNTNRQKFEELKAWKAKMEELKVTINDKVIIGIIDAQIVIVEKVGSNSVDINNNIVTINKLIPPSSNTYNLNDEHQTYNIEVDISNAIDDVLQRAKDSENIIQGEIGKFIEKILGDGFSINVGNYTVQDIPIPAGMNKENTIQALADLLTIKDFDININPKTGVLEIPSDKLDFEVIEEILEESSPADTKISIEDLISIIKKIPTLRLNLKWNTDGFSSELGSNSKVNANIGLSINLEDIVDLATDPFFEKIISQLLQGQDIDLSLIKSLADYLEIDLSKFNVGLNYGIDFKFKVVDIALNTEIKLPTLRLPKEIDEDMVNTILDEMSRDYIGKILDIKYSSNELLFSVISNWDKYNKELTEINGTIQIKIGDIILSNHKTIVPIEYVDITAFIEGELEKLRIELENILNEAMNDEKVLNIIEKVKELKDFINSLSNLDEDIKSELNIKIDELELKAKELQ